MTDRPLFSSLLRLPENVLFALFAVLQATTFVLHRSYMAPGKTGGADAVVFAVMGKEWLNGLIPYRDLFDHKGPVLYFLNMIGIWLTNNTTGIAIVEIACMAGWLFLLCKIIPANRYVAIFSSMFLIPLVLDHNFEGGNLTEEYAILLGGLSVYLHVRRPFTLHNILFIHGLLAALAFFIRPNLSAPQLVIVIIALSDALKEKQFKIALQSVLCCGLGFLSVTAVICAYFAANDALTPMVQHFLLDNLRYAKSSGNWGNAALCMLMKNSIFLAVCLAMITTMLVRENRKAAEESGFMLAFCFLAAFPSGRKYPHYFMLMIPAAFLVLHHYFKCVDLTEFAIRLRLLTKQRLLVSIAHLVLVLFLFFPIHTLWMTVHATPHNPLAKQWDKPHPPTVLSYAYHAQSAYFLNTGASPKQKYFFPMTVPWATPEDYLESLDKLAAENCFDFIILPGLSTDGERLNRFMKMGYEPLSTSLHDKLLRRIVPCPRTP